MDCLNKHELVAAYNDGNFNTVINQLRAYGRIIANTLIESDIDAYRCHRPEKRILQFRHHDKIWMIELRGDVVINIQYKVSVVSDSDIAKHQTINKQIAAIKQELARSKEFLNTNGFDCTTAIYVITDQYRHQLKRNLAVLLENQQILSN